MNFFDERDFTILTAHVGKSKNDITEEEFALAYSFLRDTYDKVLYWANELNRSAFGNKGNVKVNRKPTNRSGQISHYLWAQIYPNQDAPREIGYTVEINSDEEFLIKIDTIRQGQNEILRLYEQFRGDFYNSPIVWHIPKEEVLEKGWDHLLQLSVDFVNRTSSSYQQLLHHVGLINYEKQDMAIHTDEPLNQILYGPPGTGKTHFLKQQFQRFTSQSSSVTLDEYFINRIKDYTWWQVIGAAILDLSTSRVAEIAEHPLVRYKTNVSESKAIKPILLAAITSAYRRRLSACKSAQAVLAAHF